MGQYSGQRWTSNVSIFLWSYQTCRGRVFCIFQMFLSYLLNKGGNLSVVALLSHWVSHVVLSRLQLILLVIWLWDKMPLCFLVFFCRPEHSMALWYRRTAQQSVWYPQRLWHNAWNHSWSLILFLHFLLCFVFILFLYVTVPKDQNLSLQLRNKINHLFPLMRDSLFGLMQFSGLFQDWPNTSQINRY